MTKSTCRRSCAAAESPGAHSRLGVRFLARMKKASVAGPSPALVVALVALVAAMTGAAAALPGQNTVTSGDIKREAVRSKHIKGHSLRGSDVQRDALKGKQILADRLEAVPEAGP